jgi:hypothetical protein
MLQHAESDDLDPIEAEITCKVPQLLEAMNHACQEANTFELRANSAQKRYKTQLEHLNELYNDLRLKQGSDFGRVKPYYCAAQELKGNVHHMRNVAREFSEASLQYEQAKKQLDAGEMARLKTKINRCEEVYAECLSSFQVAQSALNVLRTRLGEDAIHRASPDIELLQEQQLRLTVELNRINILVENARAARCVYRESMDELERISIAVHEFRRSNASSINDAQCPTRGP